MDEKHRKKKTFSYFRHQEMQNKATVGLHRMQSLKDENEKDRQMILRN